MSETSWGSVFASKCPCRCTSGRVRTNGGRSSLPHPQTSSINTLRHCNNSSSLSLLSLQRMLFLLFISAVALSTLFSLCCRSRLTAGRSHLFSPPLSLLHAAAAMHPLAPRVLHAAAMPLAPPRGAAARWRHRRPPACSMLACLLLSVALTTAALTAAQPLPGSVCQSQSTYPAMHVRKEVASFCALTVTVESTGWFMCVLAPQMNRHGAPVSFRALLPRASLSSTC